MKREKRDWYFWVAVFVTPVMMTLALFAFVNVRINDESDERAHQMCSWLEANIQVYRENEAVLTAAGRDLWREAEELRIQFGCDNP